MFFLPSVFGEIAVGIHRNGYDLYQSRLDGPFPPIAAKWIPPTGAVFLLLAVTRDGNVLLLAGMRDGKREQVGACLLLLLYDSQA